MGKNKNDKKDDKNREQAKERAAQYITKAQSDGKLSKKEITKATEKHGMSMDKVLSRAATQGTQIGGGAQKEYGISQGKNTNRIDYTGKAAQSPTSQTDSFKGQPRRGDPLADAIYGAKTKSGQAAAATAQPAATKRGTYAGVDKKGQHVYRYGTGQPQSTGQPAAAAPAQSSPMSTTEQPAPREQFTSPDPQQGKSWNEFISASDQGEQSSQPARSTYQSSSGSPYDAGNPDLYGAVAAKGQDYQKRFGNFIDYAQSNAMTQAREIGDAGRNALSRLQVAPPTLDNPLSKESAKSFNRFSRKLDFG